MCKVKKRNSPAVEVAVERTELEPLPELISDTEEDNGDSDVATVETFEEKIRWFREWLRVNLADGQLNNISDPEQQQEIQAAACVFLGEEVLNPRSQEHAFIRQLHRQFCVACRRR